MRDNYKYVSLVYDYLMTNIDYKFWADYIFKLASVYKKCEKCSVLELASGNGKLSVYLYKRFNEYIISDISISMLKNNKVSDCPKICFDMLYPPLKKKFDIVICTFDSINYILSKKKLKEFFVKVSSLLNDEGIFLFDAGLIRNSIIHKKFATRTGTLGNIRFTQKSIFMEKSKIHKNIFKFYFENGGIATEVHRQKIYDLSEIIEILERAKFYIIKCLNAFTFSECKKDHLRAQFVVKRNLVC